MFAVTGMNGKAILVTKPNGVYGEGDFPELFRELQEMMLPLTIIDGEFVRSEGTFCPFDVLFVRGVDVRSLPFYSRKARLVETLKSDTEHIMRVLGNTIPADLVGIQRVFYDAVKRSLG